MRSLSVSLAIAALSLLPAVASAAPATTSSTPASDSAVLLVQGGPPQGWWEQEGHGDELRNRYWHLPPRERFRYDHLEQQIRDMQARQEQLRREQRHILQWGG
jgi:hypothetical protein